MRRRRKLSEQLKKERQKIQLRKQVRTQKVLDAVGAKLTIKEIHRKTGLSEKNIRKIMNENPEQITFQLIKGKDG